MSESDDSRSHRQELIAGPEEQDEDSKKGFSGVRLRPARARELDERQLPTACDVERVRVEVNQRGDQLAVRVRTLRDSWTIEVARESARVTSQGNYRPGVPPWVATLLTDLSIDRTMDWRELTTGQNE
ncbi:hypothetical protein G9C85_02530 [Halorubellus sp. JP-L1]|uniref:hypothetical protein n=1 Tax=Halorubellus sp. JP-L1 TaxID=2715753 RepID=UPI0014079401|nr:hypothetical protein [Halorubellus sp. JP-L1]NHN40514.1 hypothetical protein [Halorubellus sp. JP-L1]